MKQFLLIVFISLFSILAQAATPFYGGAVREISSRSAVQKDRASLLTDDQYRKEKKKARQKRHEEKAAQRKKNYQEKTKKLQSMHNYITANRTSADQQIKTKALYREKARGKKQRRAIERQKNDFTAKQAQKNEQKINVHKAARNALLRK